jgi:calcineurin-like phosphoesterase family protein
MNTISEINITPETWIISDTHFFHENIGKYCNRPENWQDLIIENWNRLISPDENVLHLGDYCFGSKDAVQHMTNILQGRLFLIRGNHDRRGKAFFQGLGIRLIPDPFFVEYGDQCILFSHRPIIPLPEGCINLHGHIHNNILPPEESQLGENHINMSVEVREYRPWRLQDILKG